MKVLLVLALIVLGIAFYFIFQPISKNVEPKELNKEEVNNTVQVQSEVKTEVKKETQVQVIKPIETAKVQEVKVPIEEYKRTLLEKFDLAKEYESASESEKNNIKEKVTAINNQLAVLSKDVPKEELYKLNNFYDDKIKALKKEIKLADCLKRKEEMVKELEKLKSATADKKIAYEQSKKEYNNAYELARKSKIKVEKSSGGAKVQEIHNSEIEAYNKANNIKIVNNGRVDIMPSQKTKRYKYIKNPALVADSEAKEKIMDNTRREYNDIKAKVKSMEVKIGQLDDTIRALKKRK